MAQNLRLFRNQLNTHASRPPLRLITIHRMSFCSAPDNLADRELRKACAGLEMAR